MKDYIKIMRIQLLYLDYWSTLLLWYKEWFKTGLLIWNKKGMYSCEQERCPSVMGYSLYLALALVLHL